MCSKSRLAGTSSPTKSGAEKDCRKKKVKPTNPQTP